MTPTEAFCEAADNWHAHLVRCFGSEAVYYRYSRWAREMHPAYDAAARAAERAYEAAFLEGTI